VSITSARGPIKHLAFCQMSSVKEQAYKSLVGQSLEYTCSALDPYNKGEIYQLEMIQYRVARFLTRHGNASSVGDMWQSLNWWSWRRKDAWFVKTANENVGITETRHLAILETIMEHTLVFHYSQTCPCSHLFLVL